ncbi:transporter substrate-binding domain-containing protein [Bacillus safensis]|uniref:transporter substrate-binding domain-containing protein n=1 Tax=Bacillus TaxID=1386 RepID=UPI0007DC3271|nr:MULTISPECIES: transporter substrate-binding domain-containing protein [Bacillus]MBW4849775.1 transporter substrate-binding domain-containing protein [Bacillaceae bacterium]MBW4852385.1 transporter substrate-binding domain-containing protein [Bacillaceae bacterium]MBW4856625.1 transporter substrate-binding domain-containing protein [Bacillaceae bacterium]MCY7582151.1 transporter substrate-binding domain-containing protein [Bacillus safensis]MCY7588732.1 transporter substrate-binding domain-c
MKKWLLLLMTAGLAAALAACGTSSNNSNASGDDKTLVMATSADYPPFESKDGDKIVGFDVDLATALAKKNGYKLEIQDMDFASLVSALKTNKADIVLAGMTPTEKRKKQVDFSDVYYNAKNLVVSKKSSGIKAEKDLKDKTVGVQLGSIQQDEANGLQKKYNLTVEDRNKISDIVQEIKAGRFDAAIIEDKVAAGYLKKEKDFQAFGLNSSNEGSAIAFKKNSDLTAKFNKSLKEMKDNGELDKLIKKWFADEK